MYVRYSSNNSGGDWWLSDDDWRALSAEGWEVEWRDGRLLGALATVAIKRGASMENAIQEFQRITGQDAEEPGCDCCGNPHEFTEYEDDGSFVRCN